jgi:hypothetical protein
MDEIEAMTQALSGAADDFLDKGLHPGDVANAFGITLAMICKTHNVSKEIATQLFATTVESVYLLDDEAQAQSSAAKKGH